MNKYPVQIPLPKARNVLSFAAYVADMKKAMRDMVAATDISRAQFVDLMNEYARLADKSQGKASFISEATFDKLLSGEERGQLPNIWTLEVMCRVADSLAPHTCWLAMYDCGVMDETARMKLEFAEEELQREARAKRHRSLKKKLLEEY